MRCGASESHGHGDVAICGNPYYNTPEYVCGECARSELKYQLDVLSFLAEQDLYGAVFWRTDGPYRPVTFFVICSDVFFWGTADAEPLVRGELDQLEKACKDVEAVAPHEGPIYGPLLWCARRRKTRPQGAAYPKNEALWPLFDACGPERLLNFGNPFAPGMRTNEC
jgi:hypothetical protein